MVAIGSVIWALLTDRKYKALKANVIECGDDLSDGLALIYDKARTGNLFDAATAVELSKKVEEIWIDLEGITPEVLQLMTEKSQQANIVQAAADKVLNRLQEEKCGELEQPSS